MSVSGLTGRTSVWLKTCVFAGCCCGSSVDIMPSTGGLSVGFCGISQVHVDVTDPCTAVHACTYTRATLINAQLLSQLLSELLLGFTQQHALDSGLWAEYCTEQVFPLITSHFHLSLLSKSFVVPYVLLPFRFLSNSSSLSWHNFS